MIAHGYGIQVEYDGTHVVVTGTNKAARIALAGQAHKDGPVVIPVSELAEVIPVREPGALRNGELQLTTTSGATYRLHYLKKHAADMTALRDTLTQQLAR